MPTTDRTALASTQKLLAKSMALNDAFAPSYSSLANVLLQLNQPDGALGLAERAVVLEPGQSNYRLLAARVFVRLSRRDEARKAATDALDLAVNDQQRQAAQTLLNSLDRPPQTVELSSNSERPKLTLSDALAQLRSDTEQSDGDSSPTIQFDAKGIDLGPWVRQLVAQVKRNWFVPYASLSTTDRVLVRFSVHKDGRITDVDLISRSSNDAYNAAARDAIEHSNPTQPLPPEYQGDYAQFTVTFNYDKLRTRP